MKHKIIDNFLEEETFKNFQKDIFNIHETPWYFRIAQTDFSVNDKKDRGHFTLNFFYNFKNGYTYFDKYLFEIYTKLNVKSLIQSRANLNLKEDNEKQKLFFHCDHNFNCKTAIFYMNTNNGGTILYEENSIKVDSIENRILIFNSKIKHASFRQTDEQRRVLININYF